MCRNQPVRTECSRRAGRRAAGLLHVASREAMFEWQQRRGHVGGEGERAERQQICGKCQEH